MQFLHAIGNVAQFVEQRLQAIGAQVHLLDQPHRLVSPADQPLPGLVAARGSAQPLVDGHVEVALVAGQHVSQGLEIGTQPPHDVAFGRRVGDRHFDRAVQSQLTVKHLLQRQHGAVQHEVGREHGVAITAPSLFDLAGRPDFLRTFEQGNLSHLHQVHPHRVVGVVDPTARLGRGELLLIRPRTLVVALVGGTPATASHR